MGINRAATENIHSNAFNFMSFLTAGVDARTGVYTCSLSLSQLQANKMMGPTVPLVLAFNPLQTRNVGFGLGWSLQLSSYDPALRKLSLSTGDTYKADKSGSVFSIRDQKLKSFNAYVDTGDTLRIEHKSGLVEILSKVGGSSGEWLPTTLHTAEGRTLTLTYGLNATVLYLQAISDSTQRLVFIVPATSSAPYPTLTMWPDDPEKKLVVQLILQNSEVTRVDLLLKDSKPSWRFGMTTVFGMRVISSMEPPSGGQDFLTYHATGLALPIGAPLPFLPCVAKHVHNPGQGQPVVTRSFEYSSKNYLGWGAPNLTWTAEGDNLYKVLQAYEYSSQEIQTVGSGSNPQVLRRTTRVYNRFHLLAGEEVSQGNKLQIKNITYYDEPGKLFADQPAQFQLPKRSEVIYRDESGERTEVTLTEFDEYGNQTSTTLPSGSVETTEYYPLAGEGLLCPPDPLGFVRSIKRKVVTPAPGYAAAPTLSTTYRYSLLKSVRTGGKDFLVLDKDELFDGGTLQTSNAKVYENLPSDPFLHGRLKTDTFTSGGKTTVSSYTYESVGNQLITTTVITGNDKTTVRSVETLDALTGQQIEVRGDDGVTIRTVHDVLGRVVSETVAPGTLQAATKAYTYSLAGNLADAIESVATDASSAKTVTRFDGLGREVLVTVEDIDSTPRVMRETYRARYDELDQRVSEVRTDWFAGVAHERVTTYAYDQWGNVSATTGPDGVISRASTDPIKRTQSQWITGAGKTVTTLNVLDKPDKEERFDKNDGLEGTTEYLYDGLGRCIRQTDAEARASAFTYDFADRLLTTTLPDGTLVSKTYAPHSTGDLPITVHVKSTGAFALDYRAGEQTYDGLSRLTGVTVANRTQTYAYVAGQSQPISQTTPSGATIEFEYQPELNNQLVRRTVASSPAASASYTYDNVHAQLLQASTESDTAYGQTLTYFPSGLLKQEDWAGGSPTYSAHYQYSFSGLPTSYIDVFGQEQKTFYDAAGRVLQVVNGDVQADFSYTPLGQLMKTVTQDTSSARSLTTSLEYDDFGRETQRTFTVSGEALPQVLKQRFDRTDKLLQRTLSAGTTTLRDETYTYDSRGRLTLYNCTGSEVPVDAAGKSLVSQAFVFDALDNIRTLTTVFVSGATTATDVATYSFAYPDKTQLSSVAHTHPDYTAQNVTLNYSTDGHQVNDEEGRILEYDALGRLTSVSSTGVVA